MKALIKRWVKCDLSFGNLLNWKDHAETYSQCQRKIKALEFTRAYSQKKDKQHTHLHQASWKNTWHNFSYRKKFKLNQQLISLNSNRFLLYKDSNWQLLKYLLIYLLCQYLVWIEKSLVSSCIFTYFKFIHRLFIIIYFTKSKMGRITVFFLLEKLARFGVS